MENAYFVTHSGWYRCMRMPINIGNAPAILQQFVGLTLVAVKWLWALFYIYDGSLFTTSLKYHIESVLFVFQLAKKHRRCLH